MGWWQIEGGDLLGDSPADGIATAFQDIADAAAAAREPKPTLQELISALAAVLRDSESIYLEKGHPRVSGTITLRGTPIVEVREAELDVRLNIGARLRSALDQVAWVYVEAVGRRPRLSELLATLTFVLSVDPGRFIRAKEARPLRSGDLAFEPESNDMSI